jgi:hypothetical protein
VTVSGYRPTKPVNLLTARMYWSCVFGDSLHIRMSSIMRWRKGEMARGDASMALLLLRSEAECLVTQHTQIQHPGSPSWPGRSSTTTARAV